jgi:hypothetical protein
MNNREHKSSSSSSRDRCIPRRFIPYNNLGEGRVSTSMNLVNLRNREKTACLFTYRKQPLHM